MMKNNQADSDDDDIPELDDVLLRQIESFKPIARLKTGVNTADFQKDGAIIEVEDNSYPIEDDEPMFPAINQMDCFEEDEDVELNYAKVCGEEMTDLTGDGGVYKLTTKHGRGPVVSSDSLCRVHYSAYIRDEMEPFDSTRIRNRHAMIRIGKSGDGLIGLQIGISTMRKEEEARFIIKPEYAYGKCGCPPRVPPNSTIIFEVELVNFIDQSPKDTEVNPYYYPQENVDELAWEALARKLEPLHKEANDLYQHKNYNRALSKYGKAFRIAEGALLYSQEDEQQMNDFCVKMFLNVAICALKLGKYKYTISMCKKVLSLQPNNLKAVFRLGQAYRLKSKFDKAKTFLLRAKAMAPLNSDIYNELLALSKKMCQAMFNANESDYSSDIDKEQSAEIQEISSKCDKLRLQYAEVNQSLLEIFELKIKNFINDEKHNSFSLPNMYIDSEVALINKITVEHGLLCDIQPNRISISKVPHV